MYNSFQPSPTYAVDPNNTLNPRSGELNRIPKATEFGRIGFKRDELYWPWFIDTSSTGDIAVADTDNHRIQVFNTHTHNCMFPPYGSQGTGKDELMYPRSVKYSPIPAIHFTVCDTGNRRVVMLRINFESGQLENVGEFGKTVFREPTDITCDWRTGMMYVTDTSLNRVTIHNKYGEMVNELRPPSTDKFYQPMGIACDEKGRVFVVDTGNNCIKVFDRNGDFITKIGQLGKNMGEFDRPKGICVDRRGYIYVADEGNRRIQTISSDLKYMNEVVQDVPLPKGVAAHNKLFVTTGDQYACIKAYNC